MSKLNTKYITSFSESKKFDRCFVGGKAYNLVKMHAHGFTVPDGYVINTSLHNQYLKNNELPTTLIQEVIAAKKLLGNKIAIRSSANCEDGDTLSMAGVFTSAYIEHDEEIASSIKDIYNQAHSNEVQEYLRSYHINASDIEMGLIVQQLIEPDFSGVIYTGVNGNNVLVQYVDGFGNKLVDGDVSGSSFIVNHEGIILESNGFDSRPFPEPLLKKLLVQVKKIEKLFKGKKQDIEFATVNNDFYILQSRTLTTDLGNIDLKQSPEHSLQETKYQIKRWLEKEKADMGTKTAVFSDSNYSELLPKPAPMDIGIYQYVSGGSDGIQGATQIGRKKMGYLVGDEATGIIHYLGGRTYFSLARNAAIYHIGFPATKEEYFQTLVNEYLEKVENNVDLGAYPQMGLYLQDPTLDDLKQRFADKADHYLTTYHTFVKRMKKLAKKFLPEFKNKKLPNTEKFIKKQSVVNLNELSNTELANRVIYLLEHIRTKTYVDFVKSARLGFYYSQRLRELFSDEIYSKLNQGLDGSAVTDANLAIAGAATKTEALKIAKETIGHFSSGEMLEIRHVPLRDAPEKMNAYVDGIRKSGSYIANFEQQKAIRIRTQKDILNLLQGKQKKEINEIITSSQTYMALRETIKYLFTKEYLLIRDTLEFLAMRLQLNPEDIYFLYPRELKKFAQKPRHFDHLIAARRQFFTNAEKFDLPAVIRECDIENLNLKNNASYEFTEIEGKFLADGSNFTGVVVNCDEFPELQHALETIDEYKKQNIKIILVATQMNLSHDPLIIHADGLIIQNAGLVAHGAQRARELGKGAMGAIKSAILPTGLTLFFDIKSRKIKKV